MSNNISHTHPITEKLLNNEISINNLNLDTFLSDRIIYPTTKKAKHKGYYAHHLIPIQEQINSYNKTHSNKFSNRIDFLKNCKELDDRCYRLTAFEHIVVHYLLALQIDSQKEALCKMVNTDFKALNNQTEKEIIETFIGMIKREITDEDELEKLEDAIAFKNVSNMPARVKCALLAWHTLEEMINKNDNK